MIIDFKNMEEQILPNFKGCEKAEKNNVQIYNAGETHRCPFVQGTADLYRTCCSSRNGRRRSFYKKDY